MITAYNYRTRFGFDSCLSGLVVWSSTRCKRIVRKLIASIVIVNLVVPYSLVSMQFVGMDHGNQVMAGSKTLSSAVDWQMGAYEGIEWDSDFGSLQLKSAGGWETREITHPEWGVGYPGVYVADDEYIYVLRGASDNKFYRYSPKSGEWKALPPAPKSVANGNAEVIDGEIYVLVGNSQSDFYKYTPATEEWTRLADYPEIVGQAHMTSDGVSTIYATRGNTEVFKYDVSEDNWSIMPLFTTSNTLGDLAYHDGHLYHLWSTIGVEHRWVKYDITNGTRTNMTHAPLTLNETNPNWVKVGNSLYIPRSANTNNFLRYDFVTDTWHHLTNTPALVGGAGGVYSPVDGYIYVFRGQNSQDIWRYDIAQDRFLGVSNLMFGTAFSSVGRGSDSFYHSGKWYVIRGLNTRSLLIYDVATGIWTTGADLPADLTTVFRYAKGALANGEFYFMYSTSSATNQFVKYTIATNTWTQLSNTPLTVDTGVMAYPGSGDYIYASRGSNTQTMWRYQISTNTWDESGMTDLPIGSVAGLGSSMVGVGGSIYMSLGNGVTEWLRYDIADQSWSSLSWLPMSPMNGSSMTYDGSGKILMTEGDYGRRLAEYTIATDSWRFLDKMPSAASAGWGVHEGSSMVSDGAGNIYLTRGASSYMTLMYVQSSQNYVPVGSWTSQAMDLGYVSAWTGIVSTSMTPGNSGLTIETMTSSDGRSWSGWQNVMLGVIASPVNRFIKVRINMASSTGQVATPILNDLTINYVSDELPPTGPSELVAKSSEIGGVSLISGDTYGYINPYFDWSGAEDGETGVDGYYVYFGTDQVADPVVFGSYQTRSEYYVTLPLVPGRYYLRVVTVDMADNKSDIWEAFEYVYSGISSDQQVRQNTSDLWAGGSSSDVDTSGDLIRLSARSGGLWLQDRLTLAPIAMSWGAQNTAYVSSTNKMYVFSGNNNNRFFEYDVSGDIWTELANAPANVTIGGGVVEGPDGYLYGMPGNNTNTFWRYSIVNNEWDDGSAMDMPQNTFYGSSLVFDGERFVYLLRGNSDDAFYSYDTWNDTWSSLTDISFGAPSHAPNNFVYNGGDLVMGDAGKIYAIGGNNQPSFSVYDVASNSWTVLSDLPFASKQGSNLAYDPVRNVLFYAPGSHPDFFRYDIASGTWTEMANMPTSINYGSNMRVVGDQIIAVVAGAGTLMWKYTISTDSWQVPTRGLFGKNFYGGTYDVPGYGASMIKGDGDHVYLMRGNGASDFVRYNTATGSLERMRDLPSGANVSSRMAYNSVNNKIYYVPYLWQKMFVYDVASNTWTEDDAPPMQPNQYGSMLEFDGERYMYWTRGATTAFYRYDYLAESGSRWESRANMIAGSGNGGTMVHKDGFIYLLIGGNSLNTYRYNVSTNTWSLTDMANLPSTTYRAGYGGSIVDGGNGYLYFVRGENSNHMMAYSLAENTWSILPNMPAQVNTAGSLVNGGDNRLYLLPGPGTNTYADGLYTYVLPTDDSAFVKSGNYTSEAIDLGEVYRYSNIRVTYQAAPESSINIETRSSADGMTWSNWGVVGSEKKLGGNVYEYRVNSPANRYLQYRISMTSLRGIWSNSVSGVEINYIQDLIAPINPENAGLVVYESATSSSQLSSNNWYPHANIRLTWPSEGSPSGATDTASGSGIWGYYVSFTIDPDNDPVANGNFQTTTERLISGLTSGQTYHLAVRTRDMAGNLASDIWRPFVYRYDPVAPTQPTTLTADPSGYTAVNSYTFDWNEATDSASGVSSYCYKTGASEGEYAIEQCTTESVVSGVTSYKKGANTFFVRTRDNAGNYSAYSTVSYYFNDDSPSPPRNLSVSPEVSTTNSFGFTWQTPEVFYGSSSNLRYYYSVNALPSPVNVSETALTNLMSGPYASLPGLNTFYVVAKDEAGNIDYSQYALVSFSANTPAPGMPVGMDIADVSIKATKNWRLAITWEPPEYGAENVASYQVWRSADDGASFVRVASTAGESYVDTRLNQITYQYKIKACDSANNCGAFGSIVEKYPDGKFLVPAEIIGEPEVSNITTKKATIDWVTERTSDSKISYGTEPGVYFDEEVGNSDQVISHRLSLTNLSPGTVYYYVAKWTDEDGNLGVSEEYSFETLPAPSAKEVKVLNMGLNSATIQFTSNGASRATVVFGKSAAFGGSVEMFVSSGESSYNILLEGLEDGTKYYYRVDLYDVDGAIYSGDIYSFETLPRPRIENVRLQQVRGTATSTLLVTWNSNTEISSIATYYPTVSPGQAKDDINLKMTKSHRALIRGLSSDTPYTLVIKGRDKGGNEAVSAPQAFTTASDTRPPEISNLNTEVTIQGVGEDATAQLIISWDTDELSTTQVVFGDGSSGPLTNKTQVDESLTYKHLVVVPNLIPSKVYHFKALSKDKSGNLAESVDTVVITPKATQSALNLVVGNLSQAFGFLGGLISQ
jgi:hypothetical protein